MNRAVPLIAVAIFFAWWSTAYSHEWYSKRMDPVRQTPCCGGSDCAKLKIDPGVLEATDEGYRVRMTLEQARRINPQRIAPVDTVVPWERIQLSEDGNYHICIPSYEVPAMPADFYCFFAPGSI